MAALTIVAIVVIVAWFAYSLPSVKSVISATGNALTQALPTQITEKAIALWQRFGSQDTGRLNTYQAGLKAALEYPMGVGPGNFERHVVKFVDPSRPYALAAHNLYLRTSVELGVAGLLALIVFAGSTTLTLIRRAWQAWTNVEAATAALLLALPSSLTAIWTHSLLIDTLHWRHLWLLLGIALGEQVMGQMSPTYMHSHADEARMP